MKLNLMQVCHRLPALRPVTRTLPPGAFLRLLHASASLSSWCRPHAKKKLRPFLEVNQVNFQAAELKRRGRRYLYCLRLFKDLVPAWANWEDRSHEWIELTGESHLQRALAAGKGALLISGHSYGFNRFLAPLLAQKGYIVNHGGGGGRGHDFRVGRWGRCRIGWRYISYGRDRWEHLKAVNAVSKALARNELVSLSIRGAPAGEKEMELDFWHGRFFLESVWFRVFERLRAPVLPFFIIEDGSFRLRIAIYPELRGDRFEMARQFGRTYVQYLREFPECGRIWRAIYLARPHW